MPLRLQYIGETTVPVEVEGLLPSAVREKSLAEVERWPIFHGNRQVPLAEFFKISGSPGDERFEFEGNLAGVHWIGTKLDSGSIHVAGNAGRHVGSEMTGGEIHVDGDASDWVGGEMHGGLIHVRGRAGDLIGSAYRGSPKGITGGSILIGGDVGNEVGHSMRRGLLAIGGSCGDFPAINMIAGSILVFGNCGQRPAPGMRRGTLALLGPEAPVLLPTFRRGVTGQPVFMRLLLLWLQRHDFAVPAELLDAEYQVYSGDWLDSGRGEILTRRSA